MKNRKYQTERTNQKKIKSSYKNNIIQFSLKTINSILINNLNSSITLGLQNITNNFIQNNNNNQIINNNIYINSINDCIDYKIKGNIYKSPKEDFFNFYPKMENLMRTKPKKELKIIKFDKEILTSKAKTPTKKISKQFCFDTIGATTNYDDNMKENNYKNIRHSQRKSNVSSNESNKYKTKRIYNSKNYYIYRTCATINSKEKNNNQHSNSNSNRNTYKKKVSHDKKYIIHRANANSKENSLEKQKINTKINNNPNQKFINNLNKKFIYKTIENNIPKRIIIYNKHNNNKDKSKITNSLKNKNINNYIKTDLNLDINKLSSKYNSLALGYNNQTNIKYYDNNSLNSNNKSPNTNRNIHYNKNIMHLNDINNNSNNNHRNELLLTPNRNINKTRNNKPNILNNRNLNIQYNPTISNNINRQSPKNRSYKNINKKKSDISIQTNIKDKNIIKNYNIIYNTISNDNKIRNQNKYFYKKVKTINNRNKTDNMNNIYETKTFNIKSNEKKNNVFDSNENSIFKVLDNTQIITPDDCRSSTNSNKLDLFSGSNSNGTDANQDTDYNSLKKFNNNFLMNEYIDNYHIKNENNNNYQNIDNFSFNNL